MIVINILISAIIQVIVMTFIPFIWWVITVRKKTSFMEWIGLKKPIIQDKKNYITVFVGAVVLFLAMTFAIVPMISNGQNLATSQFTNMGMGGLIPAIIYAFIQTSLSEEIFFRGFLGKRLIKLFGFNLGNLIQAILFGILHGFMLFSSVTIGMTIVVSIFTGLIGWLMGYINEKKSNGSIISSWCMHGIANFISAIVSLFGLI